MPGPRRNHLRRDEPARRSPGQSTINLAWGYYYNPRWPAKRPSYRPWSMGIGVCPTRRPRSRETAGPLARWSAGVREVGVATKSSARRVPPPAVNVADLLNLSTSSTPGQVRHCQSDGARSPPQGHGAWRGTQCPQAECRWSALAAPPSAIHALERGSRRGVHCRAAGEPETGGGSSSGDRGGVHWLWEQARSTTTPAGAASAATAALACALLCGHGGTLGCARRATPPHRHRHRSVAYRRYYWAW